jgi:hypothetical protein
LRDMHVGPNAHASHARPLAAGARIQHPIWHHLFWLLPDHCAALTIVCGYINNRLQKIRSDASLAHVWAGHRSLHNDSFTAVLGGRNSALLTKLPSAISVAFRGKAWPELSQFIGSLGNCAFPRLRL